MRIVINLVGGCIEDISSDSPLPEDLQILIMTDELKNAQPGVIGRADGRDVIVYSLDVDVVDDRRYWRDVQTSYTKSEQVYGKDGYFSTDGAIEGRAVEVKPGDKLQLR